jgi:hypothetical protein
VWGATVCRGLDFWGATVCGGLLAILAFGGLVCVRLTFLIIKGMVKH